MKKIIPHVLMIILSINITAAQTSKAKKDPVGDWKFEAPYAPESYTSGIITFSFAEKKYSAYMKFTGSDYKYPGANVKFERDSVFLSLYVESEYIAIRMKLEDNSKMSGKAVYSEGEIPLTLTRVPAESQKK